MGTVVAVWLGANALFGLGAWSRARRRTRAIAGQRARHRARRAHHTSPIRFAARAGLPFPADDIPGVSLALHRAQLDARLHHVVGRLLAAEAQPLAPHARPGQPMATPYDWASEPTSMGARA